MPVSFRAQCSETTRRPVILRTGSEAFASRRTRSNWQVLGQGGLGWKKDFHFVEKIWGFVATCNRKCFPDGGVNLLIIKNIQDVRGRVHASSLGELLAQPFF